MANRTATRSRKKSLDARVASVLDRLRPMVRSDGGDMELVSIDKNGVVRVRLLGACIGCPSSNLTLTMGIERNLKEQVPEVTRVICVE